MPEAPKGICGVCGREVRVRVGNSPRHAAGVLWRHGYLTERGPQTCSGSHERPEALVAAAVSTEEDQ